MGRPVAAFGAPGFVVEAREPVPCRESPEAFFAAGVKAVAAARAVCGPCPYREPCREFAVERPALWGVWGATTRHEREVLRRRRAAS